MNANQLRDRIVRPVLRYLEPEIPYSETAVELLVMTAAHESNMGYYLEQVKGPALGPYQMEPATENDTWLNFLEYNQELCDKMHGLCIGLEPTGELYDSELIGNLFYATAMARVYYFRDPQSLPSGTLSYESTIRDLAHYAKRVWNTEEGAAHADDYFNAYMKRGGRGNA